MKNLFFYRPLGCVIANTKLFYDNIHLDLAFIAWAGIDLRPFKLIGNEFLPKNLVFRVVLLVQHWADGTTQSRPGYLLQV
jgi:hypothetical protein